MRTIFLVTLDLPTPQTGSWHYLGYFTSSHVGSSDDAATNHTASSKQVRGDSTENRFRIEFDVKVLPVPSRGTWVDMKWPIYSLIGGFAQHSFLIVTLSSGIIAAIPQLVNNPTSIPTILAQNLPQASIFFLT